MSTPKPSSPNPYESPPGQMRNAVDPGDEGVWKLRTIIVVGVMVGATYGCAAAAMLAVLRVIGAALLAIPDQVDLETALPLSLASAFVGAFCGGVMGGIVSLTLGWFLRATQAGVATVPIWIVALSAATFGLLLGLGGGLMLAPLSHAPGEDVLWPICGSMIGGLAGLRGGLRLGHIVSLDGQARANRRAAEGALASD
ncbi:MAG: hypothetical protein AAGF97_02010 [Planctomycetota bacterium]